MNEVKDFINKDLPSYNLSPQNSRIGIMTFASQPQTILSLIEGISADNVRNALDEIEISQSKSDLADAFAYIKNNFDWSSSSGRSGVPKVIVLFTTSTKGTIPAKLIVNTEALQNTTKIIVVGIGKELKKDELNKLTADKDHAHVAQEPSELPALISDVKQAISESTGNHFYCTMIINIMT